MPFAGASQRRSIGRPEGTLRPQRLRRIRKWGRPFPLTPILGVARRLRTKRGPNSFPPSEEPVAVTSPQVLRPFAEFAPTTNRVERRVALAGCDHPHGLLVDASRRVAFVACDGNARLLTLDLTRMKVRQRLSASSARSGSSLTADSPA